MSLFGCEKATKLTIMWCEEAKFIKDEIKNIHAFAQINNLV